MIMVHAAFHFPSRFLGRNTAFHVLLPKPQSLFVPAEDAFHLAEKKVLWFFHGVGDDPEAVLLHTDIAELCDTLDLAVILPAVENSFCLDIDNSLRFRSYLTEELIPYTMSVLSLSPARENHLIGGISMGGYGALSIGLTHPEFFSRIFCLSGALDLKAAARYSHACGILLPGTLNAPAALDAHPEWILTDAISQAVSRREKVSPPPIYLVCSELDSVYKSNRRFLEDAASAGLQAELHTAPGLHDWKFWRENLPDALKWAIQ